MDTSRLWKQAQAELQLSLSKPNYQLYFAHTALLSAEKLPNQLVCTLSVPNDFIKDGVAHKYLAQVEKILSRQCQSPVKVSLVVRRPPAVPPQSLGPLFTAPDSSPPEPSLNHVLKKAHLISSFNFDNFAVSSSNEMAYAACRAVSRLPGKAYNPLFLYGGVGVGKTHLMQAVAQKVLHKNPHQKVVYCTGEEFTNGIIDAIQTKKTSLFRRTYRPVNLLIIDDIQFIAGKNTVQEEFFHTFNAIHQEGGQIILSSDRPPSEIQKLEDRIVSRFEAGLIVDIQEPNFELRAAIVLIKAKMLSVAVPMDVAQLVAAKIKSTRQLEGALISIKAHLQARPEPLTPESAGRFLKLDKTASPSPRTVKPREVISQVASFFNLTASQLKGKSRQAHIVLPRQIAMFLLRHDTRATLVEVAGYFSNRDHTTVMHSVEKVEKLVATSEEVRGKVEQLRQSLFY